MGIAYGKAFSEFRVSHQGLIRGLAPHLRIPRGAGQVLKLLHEKHGGDSQEKSAFFALILVLDVVEHVEH